MVTLVVTPVCLSINRLTSGRFPNGVGLSSHESIEDRALLAVLVEL